MTQELGLWTPEGGRGFSGQCPLSPLNHLLHCPVSSWGLSSPSAPRLLLPPSSPMFGRRQWPRWGRNVAADLGPEPREADTQALPLDSCPSILPPLGCQLGDSESLGFPTCKRSDKVLVYKFLEPRPGQSLVQLWFLQSRSWNGDKDPAGQPASESTYPLSAFQASLPAVLRLPAQVRVLNPFCTR